MLRILFFASFAALVLGQSTDVVVPAKAPKPQTKIVGGQVTSANAWPWQASLRAQSSMCYNHVCGGVLIKAQWVLTTATCLQANPIVMVVLGEHDMTAAESGKEQFYGVSATYIHPSWNRDLTAGNDIGLIRLTSPATLNSYIQLAPLPSLNQILSRGTTCYATGWGTTQTGGLLSAQLRQAYLPSVDYATCSSSTWWGSVAKSNMICAGGTGAASICTADGGGPLNCLVGGRYVVHGLSSFVSSLGCNVVYKPSVFTRVSAYLTWVQSYTG
ncbi:elastase-1-like [Astyanax mexicanus]|uniref:pancreatic elastase n=1 Tax=Astyanax mexicanus TaxID=7994 RepID=A0A8T2MI19_ASTMX|nr:elastase-1-like [Astyanax mexicanus]